MASYIMFTIGISAIASAAILFLRDWLTWSFLDEDWFVLVLAICGLTLAIHGICTM